MKNPIQAKANDNIPAPEGEPLCTEYEVRVNGLPVPVFHARVAEPDDGTPWNLPAGCFGGRYGFVSFDLSGPVEVEIRAPGRDLSRTVVRPSSSGIEAHHAQGVLAFALERPCRLSVEPDGRDIPLFLFANPPEEQVSGPADDGVLFFGPGIHEAGTVEVGDNQTVYLAAGAVVRGRLVIRGENIAVRGRDIHFSTTA